VIIKTARRFLPFTGGQMFDLAADIENYPHFLPDRIVVLSGEEPFRRFSRWRTS